MGTTFKNSERTFPLAVLMECSNELKLPAEAHGTNGEN